MQTKTSKKAFEFRTLRIILSFILTVALTAGMLSGLTIPVQAAQKAVYVALGDSVPAGYGLADTKDGCVQLFSDQMTESGYANTPYNYAVSGYTTQDLLTLLQNMETANPDAFKNLKSAGIITLNIGGNNVLGPLVEAINSKLEEKIKALGITSIAEANETQLLSIGTALFSMSLDTADLAKISQGAQSFSEDFPKIIEWLKNNAPGANIIVNTIYNPIPSYLSFYNDSATLLAQMNGIITDNAKESGYSVADIYTAFLNEQKKGTQILNLNLDQSKGPISVDIHPNAAGHALIARLHSDIFKTLPTVVTTKSGSPVTATIPLAGLVKKGALTATVTKENLVAVLDKAQSEAKILGREKDGAAVIFNNTDTGVKSAAVTFDSASIDLLKTSGIKQITVKTGILQISFDTKALQTIDQKTKGKVTLSITPVTKLSAAAKKLIGSRPVFKITLKDAAGTTVSDFGKGKVTVSLHYTAASKEKAANLHAVSINSKGQPKLLTGSSYSDSWLSFSSTTLSTYGIGYK